MQPGYYWVAHRDYPTWEIGLYCDGKFYKCGARHGTDIQYFKWVGPILTPLGIGHVITLADHQIVRHKTYSGPGCALCGKMDELHPPAAPTKEKP